MKLYRIVRGMNGVEVGRNVAAMDVREAIDKDYLREVENVNAFNRKVGGATIAPVLRVYEMVEVEFKQ